MFPLFDGKRNPERVREEVQREALHLRGLKLDPEANTDNYPASTEVNDVYLNLSRTMTWATGAITALRQILIKAATIAFAGASTVSDAATLAIDDAPKAGANATLTRRWALWIMAGAARFGGQISSDVSTGTAPLVIASTTAVSNLNADMVDGKHASDLGASAMFAQTADKTVANTATETTLTAAGSGSLTLAANALTAGKTVRVTASGYAGYQAGVSGTFTFRVKLGSTTICASTHAAWAGSWGSFVWKLDCLITCRTTGATGTVMGQLSADMGTVADHLFTDRNTATSTIDTTATQAVDLTAQWQNAGAGNTITCTNLTVEAI